MPCTPKLACKMMPSLAITFWHLMFMIIGVSAISEDQALRSETCGQSSHVWKYCFFNIVFAFFSLVTYFIFPGGGEGARARAVMMLIVHFGLAAWGVLMWTSLSDTCKTVLQGQFTQIRLFHHIAIVHNAVLCCALVLHEAFLGEEMGMDLTVVAEIRKESALMHGHYQDAATTQNIGFTAQPPPPQQQTSIPPELQALAAGETIGSSSVPPAMGTTNTVGSPLIPAKDPPPELNLHTD